MLLLTTRVGMLTGSARVPLPVRAVRSRPSHLRCRAGYSRKTDRKLEAPGTALPKDPKQVNDAAEEAEAQPKSQSTSDTASTATTEARGTTLVCNKGDV